MYFMRWGFHLGGVARVGGGGGVLCPPAVRRRGRVQNNRFQFFHFGRFCFGVEGPLLFRDQRMASPARLRCDGVGSAAGVPE